MFMLYFESNQGRQMEKTALCWPHIYSDILQNAPFRSQIFTIFFASGGKGALTPLTKILHTFLVVTDRNRPTDGHADHASPSEEIGRIPRRGCDAGDIVKRF